jgi:hypothetical protein
VAWATRDAAPVAAVRDAGAGATSPRLAGALPAAPAGQPARSLVADAPRSPDADVAGETLPHAPRPDGERILDEVERGLLGSEAARRCVGEGGAEIRLVVDASGVTYRFGAVEPAVGYCLMTEALPDVLATVQAPEGVRRAERSVRIPAG